MIRLSASTDKEKRFKEKEIGRRQKAVSKHNIFWGVSYVLVFFVYLESKKKNQKTVKRIHLK